MCATMQQRSPTSPYLMFCDMVLMNLSKYGGLPATCRWKTGSPRTRDRESYTFYALSVQSVVYLCISQSSLLLCCLQLVVSQAVGLCLCSFGVAVWGVECQTHSRRDGSDLVHQYPAPREISTLGIRVTARLASVAFLSARQLCLSPLADC